MHIRGVGSNLLYQHESNWYFIFDDFAVKTKSYFVQIDEKNAVRKDKLEVRKHVKHLSLILSAVSNLH